MKTEYVLPITIVVAGAIIAGGIFLSGKQTITDSTTVTPSSDIVKNLAPVSAADHIVGNPDAPLKIITYMDLECPHCKQFEATMHQVMNTYGAGGQVAWVARPFPLTQIHSRAAKEAEAAECAAAQGGSTAYFAYVDKVYEVSPLENRLDPAQLPVIAGQVGLNVETFTQCLDGGTYTQKVADSVKEAMAVGAQGTPYSILLYGGEALALSGAQQYDSVHAAIETILGESASATATTTQ